MTDTTLDRSPADGQQEKVLIISADNHTNEPRDLFTARVPASLRDRAPRMIRGADGGDGWSFDGNAPRAGSQVSWVRVREGTQ